MIVTSRDQHAIRVHSQSVDDGVVARQVLDEVAIWAHPLLDVVCRTRRKCVSVQKKKKKEEVNKILSFVSAIH